MNTNGTNTDVSSPLRILTNMCFWQSPVWMKASESIYDLAERTSDPGELSSYAESWQLFRRAKNFDCVVTMGARTGLIYGLLCALTHRPSKQILCEFFLDEPGNSLSWKLKTALQKWVARRALGFITNSRPEQQVLHERLGVPMSKLLFVPLNCSLHDTPLEPEEGDYLFSAGRSLRDYPCMLKALKGLDIPVRIVCGHEDLSDTDLPPHWTRMAELSRGEYLEQLRGCRAMILPLQDTVRPTGQLVLLEAMALAKPVIASDNMGIVDYLQDQETGLLVPHNDPRALREAVDYLLTHKEEARQMGLTAREECRTRYTNDQHAQLRLEAIYTLCTGN